MKVICISEEFPYAYGLTIGRFYNVIETEYYEPEDHEYYILRNAEGQLDRFRSFLFLTVDQYRENKINDILD